MVLTPSMLFLLLVFNPVVEELVFRKLFAQRLLQYGESFYIFASSFCFAIVHGVSQGIPQVFYTFILGLIWSYLFVKTGSLKIPILLHSLSNLFGPVITQLLLETYPELAGIYSMFLIILGFIGLIWFMKTSQKIILDNEKGLLGKGVLENLFTNKGILLLSVFTLLIMLVQQV